MSATVATRARLERSGPVATIVLSSEDGLNAIDRTMAAELLGCLSYAAADGEVGAIVLRAEGRAFCAGGSLAAFAQAGAGVHDYITEVGRDVNAVILALHESPVPTLAAVQGAVAGGGLGLMAAADIVLAGEDARFSYAYRRLGLSPDAGGSWFLVRDLGYRRAMQMYLTDETLDAYSARSLGLVTEVVPSEQLADRAASLAARIGAGPRAAQATTKRLMRQAADGQLARQLEEEILRLADGMRTGDFAEGLAAFTERRAPDFGGR